MAREKKRGERYRDGGWLPWSRPKSGQPQPAGTGNDWGCVILIVSIGFNSLVYAATMIAVAKIFV